MKARFLMLMAIFIIIACKRETKNINTKAVSISKLVNFKDQTGFLQLSSGNFNYSIRKEQLPFKKIILLNASMAGYVTELNAENIIAGISSPEYIYSEKIRKLIQQEKIQNVGNEQKYDIEKIISLKPDAVFTNYVANFENAYEVLKKNGIHVIFLDEFKEEEPLEKAAYIKVFGKLLGKEDLADAKFKEIEKNYNNLKKLAQTSHSKPKVLANEMYGDLWYLPGGKTSFANFIADANAEYILKDNSDTKAVTMSFEEVYAKVKNIHFWLNVGNHHSKKELLSINPFYAQLDVFNQGKIYSVSGKEKQKANDFFEQGIVRCDLVLKDYIKIIHPELLPDDKITYLHELK